MQGSSLTNRAARCAARVATRAAVLTILLTAGAPTGCSQSKTSDGSLMQNGNTGDAAKAPGDSATPPAVADDWGDLPQTSSSVRSGSTSATSNSQPPRKADADSDREPASSTGTIWTVVLQTLADEGHEQMARMMLPQYAAMSPMLRSAQIIDTAKGSMIVYGNYSGPGDDAAQRDLKAIKNIQLADGTRPLAGVILSRVTPNRAGPIHPYDLANARRMYPEMRTLYTLQVAAWSDFETGELSLEEIHKRAEAYAAELRKRGLDAFFHHDDDKRISVVTIGLFGSSAIDSQSGLYHPDVEMLMRQFPKHMVNGEELQEFIHPKFQEKLGTRTQKTMLVEVPR